MALWNIVYIYRVSWKKCVRSFTTLGGLERGKARERRGIGSSMFRNDQPVSEKAISPVWDDIMRYHTMYFTTVTRVLARRG